MINHLFLYKGRGSLLILSFTSSTDKWNAALVILAIALFSRSWFPLFRILPQTASWYQTHIDACQGGGDGQLARRHLSRPASRQESIVRQGERELQVGDRARVGAGRGEDIGILPVQGNVA